MTLLGQQLSLTSESQKELYGKGNKTMNVLACRKFR